MTLPSLVSLTSRLASATRALFCLYAVMRAPAAFNVATTFFYRGPRRQDIYNVLWAVVFGFATLNILSLAARRFEPGHHRLSFGELMAVMVVIVSIILLGWEMLNLFHIFPIQLRR